MNKKYNVYANNLLMQRTTTRLKADKLASGLTAKGLRGSYGSRISDLPAQNEQVWAFLNKTSK